MLTTIATILLVLLNSLYLSTIIGNIFYWNDDFVFTLFICGCYMIKFENDYYPNNIYLYALGNSFLIAGFLSLVIGTRQIM